MSAVPVKEQKPALGHIISMCQKSLQTEGTQKVEAMSVLRSLPDLCGPRRWIPSSPFKTSMLWAGATMFPSRTVH
eukprot:symbB.v1.2.034423.t1/scaffold4390.1/size40272/3